MPSSFTSRFLGSSFKKKRRKRKGKTYPNIVFDFQKLFVVKGVLCLEKKQRDGRKYTPKLNRAWIILLLLQVQ